LTDPGYPVLGNMAGEFFKRDRTARLLGVAHLLFQHPHGLTAQQIAERIGVNVRTVYRDLRALEEEVGVGVWQEGRRYGAETTSFLPPLKLTLQEAVTVFLSARLMDRFKDYRDPWVVSTFNKLASVLPSPVARHVHASLASMADRPRDEHRNRVFDLLATSWADGLKVRIWYQGVHDDLAAPARERLLSPYFLEPNARGHSSTSSATIAAATLCAPSSLSESSRWSSRRSTSTCRPPSISRSGFGRPGVFPTRVWLRWSCTSTILRPRGARGQADGIPRSATSSIPTVPWT
jgi:AcrR family transcriptional regulator